MRLFFKYLSPVQQSCRNWYILCAWYYVMHTVWLCQNGDPWTSRGSSSRRRLYSHQPVWVEVLYGGYLIQSRRFDKRWVSDICIDGCQCHRHGLQLTFYILQMENLICNSKCKYKCVKHTYLCLGIVFHGPWSLFGPMMKITYIRGTMYAFVTFKICLWLWLPVSGSYQMIKYVVYWAMTLVKWKWLSLSESSSFTDKNFHSEYWNLNR